MTRKNSVVNSSSDLHFFKQAGVFIPVIILAVSLSLTYAAWFNAKQEAKQQLQHEFDFQVYEITTRIKHRMDTYEQVLRGARGLFTASKSVERAEFKNYIETLHLTEKYPGIQGVGFSLIVPKTQEKQHVAKIQKEGFPDYKMLRKSEQEFYTSIIYLEPFTGRNIRAFGYDMYSEPIRRAALQRARDLNQAAMSGKVKLLQETKTHVQAGFLMYLPVYKNNLPHDTLAERRENIVGWVYEPFRIDDFMEGLSTFLLKKINLEVYDGNTMSDLSLMFDSDRTPNSCHSSNTLLQNIQQIEMSGHLWTVSICSTALLEASEDNQKAQVIAISGIFLTLLLTIMSWELLTSRTRALVLATKMTRELSESEARFRMMADSAPVLIWVAGLDKGCIWFNKVWLDFTGKTLEQELNNGWAEGVHPDDFQRCLEYYVSHFELQKSFNMEYRLRRYDGEYRWILDSGVPRFDTQGAFAGFIGSCIDISEFKNTQAALQSSNAALTRFAKVSAHHLSEPTRRLRSYSQHLAKLLSSPQPLMNDVEQEIKNCLGYLQKDAQKLHSMVHDIQLYLAAAEPRGALQLESVESIMEQIHKHLLSTPNALKVEIVTKNLPVICLDRPRLLDLFYLIIDNALQYGLPINANTTAKIIINGERSGKVSRYTISDNGTGIAVEYRERVFEIFERLNHNSTSGSGIGLAIARRIVESCSGKIWIESSVMSGTAVIFELPDRD